MKGRKEKIYPQRPLRFCGELLAFIFFILTNGNSSRSLFFFPSSLVIHYPSFRQRQIGKKQNPARNLQTCQDKYQYEAELSPGNDARRRVPMSDGQIDRQRSSKEGDKVKQDWNRSHHQGNGIITGTVIFQTFYFPFTFPFFKACRAQMPAVERHITQRAHKPATGGTWGYSLFTWVIKTSGLVAYLQRFTRMAPGQGPVNGRKNIRP